MLDEMRAVWDNAPVNVALDGKAGKLSGFVVPLDATQDGIREFLLVPYFGACIHTPPPPANQIVHVIAPAPVKGLHAMDTVYVSGTLKAARYNSADMGVSGYEIAGPRSSASRRSSRSNQPSRAGAACAAAPSGHALRQKIQERRDARRQLRVAVVHGVDRLAHVHRFLGQHLHQRAARAVGSS
jgi:hypothetical protein